jgi:hypothetical protein
MILLGMSRARTTSSSKTTSLLLRGVDRALVDVFKARAERHGRSLQSELQLSLRREAHRNFDEALRISKHWHTRLGGRIRNDAMSMINRDRRW